MWPLTSSSLVGQALGVDALAGVDALGADPLGGVDPLGVCMWPSVSSSSDSLGVDALRCGSPWRRDPLGGVDPLGGLHVALGSSPSARPWCRRPWRCGSLVSSVRIPLEVCRWHWVSSPSARPWHGRPWHGCPCWYGSRRLVRLPAICCASFAVRAVVSSIGAELMRGAYAASASARRESATRAQSTCRHRTLARDSPLGSLGERLDIGHRPGARARCAPGRPR